MKIAVTGSPKFIAVVAASSAAAVADVGTVGARKAGLSCSFSMTLPYPNGAQPSEHTKAAALVTRDQLIATAQRMEEHSWTVTVED
jgi:hypothetical protein